MKSLALLLALLVCSVSARAQRSGFHVVGDSSSSGWALTLEAVGYRRANIASAAIYVVPAGRGTAGLDVPALVADGACVVLEGASPLASSMGIRAARDSVVARRETDARYTEQIILWETPQRVPRVALSSPFTVFSRERWTGAPLLAGTRHGKGALLWAATSPGKSGFERFPYFLHALWDLGVRPPVVGNRLQIFFDYAYRTRADPDYLAVQWRRMGIARIFVSSWYFFERDAARDQYLKTLIDAAHRNGVTVYAWLELPHVSQHFWETHPEWREKNGLLEDALVDWRKNMNLVNPASFAAAASLVTSLLDAFDWDGVTLSELYFEGTRGLDAPSEMTPFNDDVRREVRARFGFDPAHLFDTSSADSRIRKPQNLADFRQYRAELQYRLHQQWLDVLGKVRKTKGSLGITVCYVDDVSEPAMRDLIGADVRSLVPLIESHDATLLVQDPFVLWGLGPNRYNRIAKEYTPLISRQRLAVDVNIVERKVATFPTRHQTGAELFQLVHTGQTEFDNVSLYAENSILPPDLALLPSSVATITAFARAGDHLDVDSPHGVGVRWQGDARVDGHAWPYAAGGVVWLPSGRHGIAHSDEKPPVRILDFTGDLDELAPRGNGFALAYHSDSRALLKLDRGANEVLLDGKREKVPQLAGLNGQVILFFPSGAHRVELIVGK